jgi:hypothetical protein
MIGCLMNSAPGRDTPPDLQGRSSTGSKGRTNAHDQLGASAKVGEAEEADMTRSENSTISAQPQPPALIHRARLAMAALLFVMMTVALSVGASADEAQARAFFLQFVAAQNAHKASQVRSMLWNSSSMLWVSRGIETRGADAVVARFNEYYQGTWHLEPDMSQFRVAGISNDVMQILVPIVFTRGLPGKPPEDNKFLISQTFVREGNNWFIASILPVANTQLK